VGGGAGPPPPTPQPPSPNPQSPILKLFNIFYIKIFE